MIRYAQAEPADLPAMANMFLVAFPEAMTVVFGEGRLPPAAVGDVFSGMYRHEPQGFFVARAEKQLAGFILVSSNRKTLWKNLLWGGTVKTLVRNWLTGRYKGLGIGFIPRVAKLSWDYWRAEKKPGAADASMAQVLSIAVDPAFRRQGIGRQLTQMALDYLRTTSSQTVRLEVDAAKPAPVELYRRAGFQEVARLPTPRGPALVMTLRLK